MGDTVTFDTGTADVLAEISEGVCTITLNRPDSLNAISQDMLTGLARIVDHAARSEEVACVVLTGAGRAFCSGGDVKGMAARESRGGPGRTIDAAVRRQRAQHRDISGRLHQMPKPVIASLPGAAAGAGLAIALAADLRIGCPRTVLLTAFARVGLAGDFGGTYFLTQLVGSAKARELYLLSPKIGAEEALRLGLLTRIVAEDELAAEAHAMARSLADGPTTVLGYMKENLNRAIGGDLMDCLDLEATHHVHSSVSQEHRDAIAKFMEGRK